jgi:hypothetical protein
MNLPDSNFIPAPLWLVTALHILTLSLHFAAMNFMLGGILITVAGSFTRHRDHSVFHRFMALFPSAMAATVTLGVAPLLFLQLVYPRQTYSAAIVSGWFWLLVIPVAIVAYYCLYAGSFASKRAANQGTRYLWAALPCFFYISLVYSSVFSMAEQPDLILRLYGHGQTGLQWNPELGDYLLRWLHMILGALTVGSFFAAFLAKDDPKLFPIIKKIYMNGAGVTAAAGLAYLLSLGDWLPGLMRGSAVWILAVGILTSLGSIWLLFKRKFLFSGLSLLASLVLMVSSRHLLRMDRLQRQFDPASWRIASQWSAIILFALCLVIAGVLVAYMLRLFFRRHARTDSGGATASL